MASSGGKSFSYMKKVFIVTLIGGLAAGAIFPAFAAAIIGESALSLPFVFACLVMGLFLGASLYLFIRLTLQKLLRKQLDMLRPLAGNIAVNGETAEALEP